MFSIQHCSRYRCGSHKISSTGLLNSRRITVFCAPAARSSEKVPAINRPWQEITLPERLAAVPRDSPNVQAGELTVSQPLDAPVPQGSFLLSPDRWSGSLRGD